MRSGAPNIDSVELLNKELVCWLETRVEQKKAERKHERDMIKCRD